MNEPANSTDGYMTCYISMLHKQFIALRNSPNLYLSILARVAKETIPKVKQARLFSSDAGEYFLFINRKQSTSAFDITCSKKMWS